VFVRLGVDLVFAFAETVVGESGSLRAREFGFSVESASAALLVLSVSLGADSGSFFVLFSNALLAGVLESLGAVFLGGSELILLLVDLVGFGAAIFADLLGVLGADEESGLHDVTDALLAILSVSLRADVGSFLLVFSDAIFAFFLVSLGAGVLAVGGLDADILLLFVTLGAFPGGVGADVGDALILVEFGTLLANVVSFRFLLFPAVSLLVFFTLALVVVFLSVLVVDSGVNLEGSDAVLAIELSTLLANLLGGVRFLVNAFSFAVFLSGLAVRLRLGVFYSDALAIMAGFAILANEGCGFLNIAAVLLVFGTLGADFFGLGVFLGDAFFTFLFVSLGAFPFALVDLAVLDFLVALLDTLVSVLSETLGAFVDWVSDFVEHTLLALLFSSLGADDGFLHVLFTNALLAFLLVSLGALSLGLLDLAVFNLVVTLLDAVLSICDGSFRALPLHFGELDILALLSVLDGSLRANVLGINVLLANAFVALAFFHKFGILGALDVSLLLLAVLDLMVALLDAIFAVLSEAFGAFILSRDSFQIETLFAFLDGTLWAHVLRLGFLLFHTFTLSGFFVTLGAFMFEFSEFVG